MAHQLNAVIVRQPVCVLSAYIHNIWVKYNVWLMVICFVNGLFVPCYLYLYFVRKSGINSSVLIYCFEFHPFPFLLQVAINMWHGLYKMVSVCWTYTFINSSIILFSPSERITMSELLNDMHGMCDRTSYADHSDNIGFSLSEWIYV